MLNGVPSVVTQWLYPHIDFGVNAGSFDCAEFIEDLDAVLVLIAPEFAIADTEVGAAIAATCEAAVNLRVQSCFGFWGKVIATVRAAGIFPCRNPLLKSRRVVL
jgi:hypothetical protein